MKIIKTMVEDINVEGMSAEAALTKISASLEEMKASSHYLDNVSFMKLEMFSKKVPNNCTCGATIHMGIHGGQCKSLSVEQIPHVRIVVKVTADAKEAGKE